MNGKHIIAVLLLVTLTACRNQTSSETVIEHARFVKLYCDLAQTAQRSRDWGIDSAAARRYADSTMASAGVSDEQFEATLRWYNEDVKRWHQFSEEVIHTLETPSPATPPPR